MTTFHLVRHAAHDLVDRVLAGRKLDIVLNAAGRRQAEAIATELARAPVRHVIASPRRRARQTAEPIAAAHRLRVSIAPQIDEHDCGLWAGCEFDALARDPGWRLWNDKRGEARPPCGESMHDLQARVVSYVERLSERHPDETIVLVSHAEPIRAILLHERGLPLGDCLRLDVPLASVTTIARASAPQAVAERA